MHSTLHVDQRDNNCDADPVVSGESSTEQTGDAILELVLRVASGEARTKAEILSQDDFIPWKRGVSL